MSLIPLNFYKVLSLPATLQANSMYFVQNGNYAETYITDSSGASKKVGNTQMIQELTQSINAGFFT
jgi:hypothetical protein